MTDGKINWDIQKTKKKGGPDGDDMPSTSLEHFFNNKYTLYTHL